MELVFFRNCVHNSHICKYDFVVQQSLKTGVLLLGCVKEIREFEVILSLPFNIQVQLSHANISDPISEIVVREIEMESEDEEEGLTDRKDSLPELKHLFYVGQYLVCRVVGVKDKKISVSINPRLINEDLTGPLVFKGMVNGGGLSYRMYHFAVIDIIVVIVVYCSVCVSM